MASQAKRQRVPSWDVSSAGESAQESSATDSGDWRDTPQPEPYQSRLPEIDKMLDAKHSRSSANKVRHGAQYRAVRRVSITQSKGDEFDVEWLKNAEIDLWYTHSDDPFPGGLSQTVPDDSSWDVLSSQISTIGKSTPASAFTKYDDGSNFMQFDGRTGLECQGYVSSSDSDTGGVKLDIDWDIYQTAYIKAEVDDFASEISPDTETKASPLSGDDLDKEGIDGDTEKAGQVQSGNDLSAVINGALSNTAKKVTFDIAKPKPRSNEFQEDDSAYDDATTTSGPPYARKATKNTSSIRYADMKSSSAPRIKVSKVSLQSAAAVESRVTFPKSTLPEYPPKKAGRPRSHVLGAGSYSQLDGVEDTNTGGGCERGLFFSEAPHGSQNVTQSRRRGSRRPSIIKVRTPENGWIEFHDPKSARTSLPLRECDQESAESITANKASKDAAALSAWAAFPAQAAKEDREAALAYEAPILGQGTNVMVAAPVIKETYKKVVVSDKFERKIVEKSVNIIE